MTRDEAIAIRRHLGSCSGLGKREFAALEVDNWVALGMLKLDEPKPTNQKLYGAMIDGGFTASIAAAAIAIIENAGLKIVEK